MSLSYSSCHATSSFVVFFELTFSSILLPLISLSISSYSQTQRLTGGGLDDKELLLEHLVTTVSISSNRRRHRCSSISSSRQTFTFFTPSILHTSLSPLTVGQSRKRVSPRKDSWKRSHHHSLQRFATSTYLTRRTRKQVPFC